MKGLIIYDIKTMKSSRLLLVIIFMVAILTTATNGLTFSVPYMTIFMAFSAINTALDSDNTMAYMFTLPVSRETYVKEKYIFTMLFMLAGSLAIGVVSVVICLATGGIISGMAEFWMIEAVSLAGGYALIIYTLPIIWKWGNINGRTIAVLLAVGGFFGVMTFVNSLVPDWERQVMVLKNAADIPKAVPVIIGVLAAVLLGAVSYGISLRMIKNKEF